MRLPNKKLFCSEFYDYVECVFDWNNVDSKSHDWSINHGISWWGALYLNMLHPPTSKRPWTPGLKCIQTFSALVSVCSLVNRWSLFMVWTSLSSQHHTPYLCFRCPYVSESTLRTDVTSTLAIGIYLEFCIYHKAGL